MKVVSRFSLGIISSVLIGSGISYAQTDSLSITAINGSGELTFTDDPDAAGAYRLEWSSAVDGPWQSDWSDLNHVQKLITEENPEQTVNVPVFYRVLRNEGMGDLPNAVKDEDFYDNGAPDPAKVELGRLLFFDKVLSGNRNISCATCHHAMTATSDALSLSVGEGGVGLGLTRDTGSGDDAIHERVPRNAPPVFNRGAKEFSVLFHDGRVEEDINEPTGFRSPAGADLPSGLDNALAVQAMFPVTSGAEMAGQTYENEVSELAAASDLPGVWAALAARLQAIPDYVSLFQAAYPSIQSATDITFVHVANAIAAFESDFWRADNSPFDQFLRGDQSALSSREREGMELFYGKANCASCHSGVFQTDHLYHAIAMPQVGPGKGDGVDGREDHGRKRVTADDNDLLKFLTPTLRNISLTGPYGHGGAFRSLRGVVEHHLDPVASITSYDSGELDLPLRPDLDALDLVVMNDSARVNVIAAENELTPVSLTEGEVDLLMEFLHTLTDVRSTDLRGDIPEYVPSGEPLAE